MREDDFGKTVILGAGVTGLAAACAAGAPVYEAAETPGGICSSFYMRPGTERRLPRAPQDGEAYRFEVGGGHWIYGADQRVLPFISSISRLKYYPRRSSVYFPKAELFIPYPLQNNLRYLPADVRTRALAEMLAASETNSATLAGWLEQTFGPTLTKLFFGPFHQLYTAGLCDRIAPTNGYKSPIDRALVVRGASDETPPVGYNTSYAYPENGLDDLVRGMAGKCTVQYRKKLARIDVRLNQLLFDDGSGIRYGRLVSTLALRKMLEMAGLEVDEAPDPYTSVLVINIGAIRGARCPDDHWLYLPSTKAGFHRVGFYSNVDAHFLPMSSRTSNARVSIYVERAFAGGCRPSQREIERYAGEVVNELQQWGFIGAVEAIEPTWIEVAYTWSWPGSQWRVKAVGALEKCGIFMAGRYGKWAFQGIAESIMDGFLVGETLCRPMVVIPAPAVGLKFGIESLTIVD